MIGPWLARNALVVGKPTFCTVVGGFTFWGAHNDKAYDNPALRGAWIRCSDLVDADHPLPADEVGKDATAWRYGMDFVRGHMHEIPGLTAWKLYRLIGPPAEVTNGAVYKAFLGGWLLTAPFVLVGFLLSWRRSATAAMALLIPVLVTVATVVIFYGSERFRDGIAPIVIVYAALGATALLRIAAGATLEQERELPPSTPATAPVLLAGKNDI